MKRPSVSHPPVRPIKRRQPPSPPKDIWRRRAERLRGHPFVVIMETIGLVGLIFAVGLFFYELRERQDERIARAWQLLTEVAPGNSGKREALEYLNSQYGCLPMYRLVVHAPGIEENPIWKEYGFELDNVMVAYFQLEEFGIGIAYIPDETACWKKRVTLTGIGLSSDRHQGSVFLDKLRFENTSLDHASIMGARGHYARFRGSSFKNVDFREANFYRADFTDVTFSESDFAGAGLVGASFTGATLINTSLANSLLYNADFSDALLAVVNVSNARMRELKINRETKISVIWAYEGSPPSDAPDEIMEAIAYRRVGEKWEDFRVRITKEFPHLGWKSNVALWLSKAM